MKFVFGSGGRSQWTVREERWTWGFEPKLSIAAKLGLRHATESTEARTPIRFRLFDRG